MTTLAKELLLELGDFFTLDKDVAVNAAFGGCDFTPEEIEAAPEVELLDFDDDDFRITAADGAAARWYVNLARELKRHGVKIKKVDGWKTRSAGGSFTPRGIMEHHTASNRNSGNAPALGICVHGRSDLPGPLCNLLIARDGTVIFIAAGRANHAGVGGPLRGIPANSGNQHLVGVECENDGVGEKWPSKQRESMALTAALVLVNLDRGARMCVGHKEWTTRKIDPKGISMPKFRERVRTTKRKVA